ncbi:sigma factor [Amycolatopsis magusensis]|uniref:sigma factor n=1 Tax=Amycolatopsis magusensis TaxID=882444 RepID=UPI0024A8A4F6|nr:sigma factor [Amycolatopsis magusensis]MDI5975472.1 sigma factor [Amycolatopsis magusensis]
MAENRQRWARYDHVTDYDELVAALDSGQIGALELIRPLVVRYCRAHIGYVEGSFAEADQVAREACISVLRALPGYRITDRSFLGIVYTIARELVRRHATGGLIEQEHRRTSGLKFSPRRLSPTGSMTGEAVQRSPLSHGHCAMTSARRFACEPSRAQCRDGQYGSAGTEQAQGGPDDQAEHHRPQDHRVPPQPVVTGKPA